MPDLEPLYGDGDEPREIKALRHRLNGLPPGHALAFGASCCERILPCYEICARLEKRGDFPTLRRHLDAIWDLALRDAPAPGSPAPDREDARVLIEELNRVFGPTHPRVPRPSGCYDWTFYWVVGVQAEYAVHAVAAMEQGCFEGREADYAAVA